ncbi:MAG: hypothetical protein AAFO69_00940 [Bacteroidota bacterium]
MQIKEISNLFNFGLLVLTWMVQLIVYPGFQYYNAENLDRWHQAYTPAISIIVIPLMFGQLFATGYQLFRQQDIVSGTVFLLVVIVWVLTFVRAVPLHNQIAVGSDTENAIQSLLGVHWYRTVVWSLIFILGLFSK